MMLEPALTSFIVSLFSIMNPIGNVGVFASMTADRPALQARSIAWMCSGATMITLLIMAWSGSLLLDLFGITVDSLRAAGGIIVLLIGLHTLFNKSGHKQSPEELEDAQLRESIAVVPLAIPLVAGPGTMVTVLVAVQHDPSILSKVEISGIIVVLATLIGFLFSFAAPIAKWLGKSGIGVVTRVMGMVLATIAMKMMAEGLKGMLPGLAG